MFIRNINKHEIFRRKREAREPHLRSKIAKKLRGHKAKLYHKKRYSEKVQMRKLIKQHEEKQQRSTVEAPSEGAIPAYLLDRQKQVAGNVLSNAIKQKRKEKAVRFLYGYFCIHLFYCLGKVRGPDSKSESCE
jgi:ribosome biogenesis protein NSA2